MEDIILVGGGGHAVSVIDSIRSSSQFNIKGIVDNSPDVGANVLQIPVIGRDDMLETIYKNGIRNAAVTVGSVGNTDIRLKLYMLLRKIGFFLPVIKDSSALIGSNCFIDEGTFVGKGAIINAGSSIGKMSVVNSRSVVEHNCCIGDFCHIAPGVVMGGNVIINNHAHVGIGSTIIQGITINEHVLIGAGSVVVKDILKSNIKAYGNPCREVI